MAILQRTTIIQWAGLRPRPYPNPVIYRASKPSPYPYPVGHGHPVAKAPPNPAHCQAYLVVPCGQQHLTAVADGGNLRRQQTVLRRRLDGCNGTGQQLAAAEDGGATATTAATDRGQWQRQRRTAARRPRRQVQLAAAADGGTRQWHGMAARQP